MFRSENTTWIMGSASRNFLGLDRVLGQNDVEGLGQNLLAGQPHQLAVVDKQNAGFGYFWS